MSFIEKSLTLPHTGENKPLHKMIRGSLTRKKRNILPPETHLPWPETLFLLNRSTLFKKLPSETQAAILKTCNEFILTESYFIEKAGLAYCAKMILLGETTEIRQMYGLIASDEATHLEWLIPHISPTLRTAPQGQFISLISHMIEESDTNVLYFLIQTILEGWGIYYYKTLAATCQNEDLKKALLNIVKDEAIHYKTGIALFDPQKINTITAIQIEEGMKAYADSLRVGSQNIVSCIEKVVGTLTRAELITLFEDLQTETMARIKLTLLKNIMNQPFMGSFVDHLKEKGYLKPYDAKACATIYLANKAL